jgi:hypothetical protein
LNHQLLLVQLLLLVLQPPFLPAAVAPCLCQCTRQQQQQ